MCLYPKFIKNPKYRPNKKNQGDVPHCDDERVLYVPIGCGHCMECMKQKANQWKVRLFEDIRNHRNGRFITLTFSNQSYAELADIVLKKKPVEGYTLDNAIATLAVRRFLERWRKSNKKSVRHWLITELGHNGTENIHLHGIIYCDDVNEIEKHWQYGYIWKGKKKGNQTINYVSEKTINYIIKYVTKVDLKHKYYKPVILCSAGIGSGYMKRPDAERNTFKFDNTKDTYKTRTGHEIALPIYYRNKIYSEEERELLWLQRLNKEERWINGERIKNINTEEGAEAYNKLLKWHQAKNKELGYGNPYDWNSIQYERDRRKLKQLQRIENARKKDSKRDS